MIKSLKNQLAVYMNEQIRMSSKVKNSSTIGDSWLNDSGFKSLIKSPNENLSMATFKQSDLNSPQVSTS